VVRYAIARAGSPAESGKAAWPPALDVETVIDYATPHNGANGACVAYYGNAGTFQEQQQCSRSGLLNYLRDTAQGPQGARGTKWSLFTSVDDWVVKAQSAVDMDNARAFAFWYRDSNGNDEYDYPDESCSNNMGHMDYFDDQGAGSTRDSCMLYDYSGKRNMLDKDLDRHPVNWSDPNGRAIRLGLIEAVM
jgi:hypothetical protein